MEPATAKATSSGIDLNITEHLIPITVETGEDEQGNVTTATFYHRFRKQEPSDVLAVLAAINTETRKKVGQSQQTAYGNPAAIRRYWDKHNFGVKGYDTTAEWREVDEATKPHWHPSHKKLAVYKMLQCETRISGAEITFDGSVWKVECAVPDFALPFGVLSFQVGEWSEQDAAKIEKDSVRFISHPSSSQQETTINVALNVSTLKGLIKRVDGCHLDGKNWDEYVVDEASKARFLGAIYPAWLSSVADVLFSRWQTAKRD